MAHIPFKSIDVTKGSWKVMNDEARNANECVTEELLMSIAFLLQESSQDY